MSGESGAVSVSEKFDSSGTFLVLIIFVVCFGQAILRYIGNSLGWPGLTAFAGG